MAEGDRPRLLAGVAKLRSGLASQLAGVFGRGSLSEDDWEELEDLLIAADVGPTFADTATRKERCATSKQCS